MESILDHMAEGRRPWLLLILLCFSLFLPGIADLPPVDRDEARYVQATRQMLETGDFVRIRFQDEARNRKPAGVYWLQAAAMAVLAGDDRTAVWPARLVSVAGATLAVLLTFGFGAAIFDRRTGLLGAGLLAVTADLVFEAHVATTDAVLLPAAVAAQGTLALAYLAERRHEKLGWGTALGFWLAQGLALMIKGPVVPALSALTAATLAIADRRVRWLAALRPLVGLPLAIAVVAPWLVLIQRDTGGQFLADSVGHDLLGKLIGAQEAHGAPPGSYLALLPVTFWPATLFLGPAVAWTWHSRKLPGSRLLMAWVVPFWVVLELVPTKLPHYVLPLYPALALAAARGVLTAAERGPLRTAPWLRFVAPLLFVIVGIALGAAVLALPTLFGLKPTLAGALAAAGAGATAWQVGAAGRLRAEAEAAPSVIVAALAVFVCAYGFVLPPLDPIWLSRSAARLVAETRQQGEGLAVVGYAEPSLVYLTGTDTRLDVATVAASELADRKVGLVLVADGDDEAFRTALAGRGAKAQDLGTARGFDYSNGKFMALHLYRLSGMGD